MLPYKAFNFLIEIRSLVVASFSEVSGLQAETETEEYHEGGRNSFVHKLPKVTKYPNLVLSRGITNSTELWQWHQNVIIGQIQRQNGSVILLDDTCNEKWRWNFTGAYPVKWVGPDLKGDSNAVAVETLELAHNGLYKA
ncbi:phage tail protein [Mastigocoleus testarum]|uniref:Phage tail protein n=1 Tax=Mastigocoleus testarum BC008 TaxID=371196 RepID=A0A0V7ZCF4_9CYAN|nr:phage tail protein [Mastigocoleus testarum]KST62201.1 phage tail protein [Mastigocoleus testarum BC008]KST64831.1 phage tail protein [Mastigocoleus testarum BC008]